MSFSDDANDLVAPPREALDAVRRRLIVRSVIDLAGESPTARLTISGITTHARLSRNAFYRFFIDLDDCLSAVFDEALVLASAPARTSTRDRGWAGQLRARLQSTLGLFDDSPGIARLCVLDQYALGERMRARRIEVIRRLETVVDRGRDEPRSRSPAPITAEATVAGVLAVINDRLLARRPEPLTPLLNQLMAMIVLPYLGPGAAEREETHAVIESPPTSAASNGSLGRRRTLRLTDRTVRVLVAVAEKPGANNRALARLVGIADEGQMSKLMRRLADLGLVVNASVRHRRGKPNAWTLTAEGQVILGAEWAHGRYKPGVGYE